VQKLLYAEPKSHIWRGQVTPEFSPSQVHNQLQTRCCFDKYVSGVYVYIIVHDAPRLRPATVRAFLAQRRGVSGQEEEMFCTTSHVST
jgi:hypothetical protein